MNRSNFYILSGGPGAGKTTTLETLAAMGHLVVPETARRVLRQEAATRGQAGDSKSYRDRMLALGCEDYRAASHLTGPVFFDRGIPELSGFALGPGECDPPELIRAIEEHRYNQTVFLFPPWQAIYVHDDLRKHAFEHAVNVYAELKITYPRMGYRILEVPMTSVDQ